MMSSKDKYETINRKWGDFDSEYYIILNAVDRLKELLEDKYGSLYKASIALGFHRTYLSSLLSSRCMFPRVVALYKICKELDISLNYAILGEGDRTFRESEISFSNFLRMYNSTYRGRKHMSLNVSVCRYLQGLQQNLPLKYLIRIAREQHVTIDWLIGD